MVAKRRIKKRELVTLSPTKIYVKDLGPVKEADIELRKLTLLMGPNNTGKTYTATLTLVLDRLLNLLNFVSILSRFRIRDQSEEVFKRMLSNILTRFYSVGEPTELIRHGSDQAKIGFILRREESLGDVFEVKILISKSGDVSLELHGLEELINRKVLLNIFPPIYIPAERAGIMRTYKQLLRLHIETSWFDVPPRLRKKIAEMIDGKMRLPGVVGVLLDHILSMDKFTLDERKKAAMSTALDILEEEVLCGRLEMKEDLSVMYYEKGSTKPIDLINASSMISEVSAIYLLSGMLRKGGWLIIEEPESHVHPRGQMGLARFMASLARNGVNVLTTTHSDLIALKLAQMVGLAGLRPQDRVKLGYREDEYLTNEDLAIYFMEQTENGSIAKKIHISETGEVSAIPTYSKVIEEMYGEAVKLLELHGKIPKLSEAESL